MVDGESVGGGWWMVDGEEEALSGFSPSTIHRPPRTERRQQTGVDARNRVLEVLLEHAVELDALPRSETQRPVRVLVGQLVHGEVLRRSQPPARDLAAQHEHIVLADAVFLACLAGVAVFLLVGAVKLEQVLVRLTEMVRLGEKVRADGAAQLTAVLLHLRDGRALRRRLRGWGFCGRCGGS